MRMSINVRIPHEQFNKAAKDGRADQKLRRIPEEIKTDL